MLTHNRNFIISAAIIAILHLVGAVGIMLPASRDMILPLSPVNLMISAIILIAAHRGDQGNLIKSFIACFVIGFGVEVLGVQTGFPFGAYSYGQPLGWKIAGVPLIIGVNWFMLSYVFYDLANRILDSVVARVIFGGLCMVMLDVLIEPVAISLGYWQWHSPEIPLENYCSWFVIAAGMQFILWKILGEIRNPLAPVLLIAQLSFFLLIFFT